MAACQPSQQPLDQKPGIKNRVRRAQHRHILPVGPGTRFPVQRGVFCQHNTGSVRQHGYRYRVDIPHHRNPGAIRRGAAHDKTQQVAAEYPARLTIQSTRSGQHRKTAFLRYLADGKFFHFDFPPAIVQGQVNPGHLL